MSWFWPNSLTRIWYRTRDGRDPVFNTHTNGLTLADLQWWAARGARREQRIDDWLNEPANQEEPIIPMGDTTRPQQDPKPGKTAITALVIADIEERRTQGIAKYGTELKSDNGRDPFIDAYQEALDLVMYLRQAIEERRERTEEQMVKALQAGHQHLMEAVGISEPPQVSEGMKPGNERAMPLVPLEKLSSAEVGPAVEAAFDLKDKFVRPGRVFIISGIPSPIKVPESVLQEAQRLVVGDRGTMYGHPIEDFGRTAGMLNALLGTKLNAPLVEEDIAKMMICVKLSREQNKPKRDNVVDLAGYALTLEMVKEERVRRGF